MAKRSSDINSHGCEGMSDEAVLEKMIKKKNKKQKGSSTIKTFHEKWAVKNGYRNNDRLNSQNTISFKNGAEK
jgi:hypothetical protein